MGSLTGVQSPPLMSLIKTGRIRGTIFTYLFTLAGFVVESDEQIVWLVAHFAALSCSLVHMSIMTFNDWCDRVHDLKKGKRLAYDHPIAFWRYWVSLTALCLLVLASLAILDMDTALFCAGVLALGLLYSYVDHIVALNNLIVAACGASPVLCGTMYLGSGAEVIWKWYAIFFFLILAREMIKDMEDADIDVGYKNTFVVLFGLRRAKTLVIASTVVAGCFIAITKKAKEGLIFLAVLIYKFVKWDPTSICKKMIILYDTMLGLMVIFLAVPKKYGYREVAMLDFWSIEHLLMGVVLFAFLRHRLPEWSVAKLLMLLACFAYAWELVEYAMELGYFGDSISSWKSGFEHWSNRLIADPLLALFGVYIQLNWKSAWKWAVGPWMLWGMINYMAPDSITIQKAILDFLA